MKDQIKYSLVAEDCVLAFVIHKMKKHNRATKKTSCLNYCATNGVEISSISHPAISNDVRLQMFLRGSDKQCDKSIALYVANNPIEVAKLKNLIDEALVEWNERGGFENE